MGTVEASASLSQCSYKVRTGDGPTLGGSREVSCPFPATKNAITLLPEGALGWTLVPCKVGRMTLHLESIPFTPTFCGLRAHTLFWALSFPRLVCTFFWGIVMHLEEAVWAEMTTELQGIFKESNNHSAHIY